MLLVVLTRYKEVKLSFEFEHYLDKLVSRNLRSCITKLRVCAHNLRIHNGRYKHLDRNVRYCQVCNIHDIEDEFHFVSNCSSYNNLRQRYVPSHEKICINDIKCYFLLLQTFCLSNCAEQMLKISCSYLV